MAAPSPPREFADNDDDDNTKVRNGFVQEAVEAVAVIDAVVDAVVVVQNGSGGGDDDHEEVIDGGEIPSRRGSIMSTTVGGGGDDDVPVIVISPEELEKLEVRDREPDQTVEDMTKVN